MGRVKQLVDATAQFFGIGADPAQVEKFVNARELAGSIEQLVEQQRDVSRQLQAAQAAKKRGELAVDGRAVDFEISRLEAAHASAARNVQNAKAAAGQALDLCPDATLSSRLSAGRERRRQAIQRVAEFKRALSEAEDDRQKWGERLASAEEVAARYNQEDDKRAVRVLTKEVAQAEIRIETARDALVDAERKLRAAEDFIDETKSQILGLN